MMFIRLFVAILSTKLTDALILRSAASNLKARGAARDKQYLSAALKKRLNTNSTELANDALQTSASESADMGEDFYLSEAGYQAIAALHSDDAMAAFSRVLLAKEGKMVSDEGELSGLVPWFSGTSAVQTLVQLKTELLSKTWVVPDVVPADENESKAMPWTSPVTEGELKKLPEFTDADLRATAEEGEQLYANRANITKEWTSPVTEEESQKMPVIDADLKATAAISTIRLQTLANDTADDDTSGYYTAGNFVQRVAEKVPMDLATLGGEATLNEAGFQSVAKTGSTVAMDAFVRKVLATKAWRVTDETFMVNVLPWYTGECANQSYDALVSELHRSRKAHSCHPSWIGNKYGKQDKEANRSFLHPATSRNLDQAAFSLIRGMIAQTGAAAVPGTRERMWTFVRSMLKRNGTWEEIEALGLKNNTRKWLSFKNATSNYSKGSINVAGGARDWLKNVGAYAPLNEDGYKAVVDVRNDTQMQMFVRRVARNESLNITDQNGLSGFSMYYSGFCAEQSYAALTKEVATLMASHYITNINYDVSVQWMPSALMLQKRLAKTAGVERSQIKVEVVDIPEPDAAQAKAEYSLFGAGFCSSNEKEDGSRLGDWVYAAAQTQLDAIKACDNTTNCKGFHWNVIDSSFVLVNKVGPELGNSTEKGELCYQKPEVMLSSELVAQKVKASLGSSVSYEMLGRGSCSSVEKTDGSRMGDWIYGQSMLDAEKACEFGIKEDMRECIGFHWNVVDASYVLVAKVGAKLGSDTDKGELCYKKPVVKQEEYHTSLPFLKKKLDVDQKISANQSMNISTNQSMNVSANQTMKISTNQSIHMSTNQTGKPTSSISLLEVASTKKIHSHPVEKRIQKRLVISVATDSLEDSKRVEASLLTKIYVKNGQIEVQAAPSTLFVQGSTKPPQCGGGLAKKRFFEV